MLKQMLNRRGLTLIELIVATSLGLAVIMVAGSLLFTGFRVFFTNTDVAGEQNSARSAMLRMTQDLHRVEDISTVVCGGSTLTIGGEEDTVTYSFNAGDNTIRRNGVTLVSRIDAFSATRDGNTVTLSIVTDKNNLTLISNIELR